MKSFEIFVRHDAELDALGYFQYINQRNPDAAARFMASVDTTIGRLAIQPMMGTLRRFRARDLRNIRSWRINGFEHYLIFYRFENNRLDVLRIKHGAMKFPRALQST